MCSNANALDLERYYKEPLTEKDKANITYASQAAHWKPTPGTLIIMPAYVTHQYSMGGPNQAFRFIHFNVQAIHNTFMKEEASK